VARKRTLAQRLEGLASVWWRATVQEGLCASCAHEDGEVAIVGGTHEVGEEAGVGGDGQQLCVAEVTCVV
jgi:hypothetical protein